MNDVVSALFQTEQFQSEVSDDLVGVHVETGASSTLEDIDWKLIHAASLFQDFITCGDDDVCNIAGQRVDALVGNGRGLLHHHHATNEFGHIVDGLA